MTHTADEDNPRRSLLRSISRFWWLSVPVGLAFAAVAIRPLFDSGTSPEPPQPVTLSQLAETRTVPVAAGTQLIVQVGRGDLEVIVGEPGFVRFTVTRFATAPTNAEAAAAIETVHVRISGGDPLLSFVVAVDRSFDTGVTAVIEVPPGLSVQAETIAGDVLLDGPFTGRVEAGTGRGTLEVRLPHGWHAHISADAPEVLSDFALEPVDDAIPTVYRTPGTTSPVLVLMLRTLGGPIIVREG
ncbi:MAG: hypothetical protein AB7T37_16280 [Dehalococcoidia bacterium]